MKKLKNIISYLVLNYPKKNELSKARLTKMIYLSDWFSAILMHKQITNISWLFNHFGPDSNDIIKEIEEDSLFEIKEEATSLGNFKTLISYSGDISTIEISIKEQIILDLVIQKTKDLYYNDFIDYVYSTYPIQSSKRYSNLHLVELAKQLKAES